MGIKDEKVIRRMARILSHRGPDDETYEIYPEANIYLGHRRLSIIDLEGGRQPIFNEDNTIGVICNGEIYNFQKLRADLKRAGHTMKTRSDTEVIVHLYEEYGLAALTMMNGMFALAIIDKKNNSILLARDRLGIKPLYYSLGEDWFSFASEIKALLLVPRVSRDVNRVALQQIMNNNFGPAEMTCFRDIYKLPAGHWLFYKNGKIEMRQYWDIPYFRAEKANLKEWADRLQGSLRTSVQRRLVADVPIAAALSGGLDSSTIVALMAQETNGRVKTFTAGYGPDDPEFAYAAEVAKAYRTNHTELIITPEDLRDLLPRVVWSLEEPIARTDTPPLYYIFQKVAPHAKVLLVGEGADEIFAGYPRYKVASSRLPLLSSWRRDLYRFDYSGIPPVSLGGRLATAVYWRGSRCAPPRLISTPEIPVIPPNELFFKPECLNHLLRYDQKGIMVEFQLKRVDSLSMAHSVEARVPFLDHEVVELASCIPERYKISWKMTGKNVLREAVRSILPPSILNRPKYGQRMSIGRDMTIALENLGDLFLRSKNVRSRGFFKVSDIERLRARQGDRYNKYQITRLWSVILAEIWARLFLDGRCFERPPRSYKEIT
ncbi:asparagine synthase (glutamine-hydrolyzing) [bacterium]|nr:asparagine synthase (glutamine-hydrolyzing) [bacterium]